MLPDKELRELARKLGLAPGAVQRMLGSVSLVPPQSGSQSASTPPLDLGLRLSRVEKGGEMGPPIALQGGPLEAVFLEYRAACPLVVSWLASGNFDPTKPPERMSRATLVHASRTVGRLRAKYIRSVSP